MRVLFLTHRVPYAPNRGDRIRAYHMLRYLEDAGVPVCLVALAHDDEEEAEGAALAKRADAAHVVRVTRTRNLLMAGLALPTDRPLTHVLLDSPRMRSLLEHVRRDWRPDVVLAYCSGMARFAMEPPLNDLPFVLDMVDVDSFKWEALAATDRGPRGWIYRREARDLRRFETAATKAAAATLVTTDREADALRSLDPSFVPVLLPNGVDVDAFRNPGEPSAQPEVVFAGVFSYAPNENGALWLIEHVWPRVIDRLPQARLTLVGTGPSATLEARAARAGVVVTGAVADVREHLWHAAIAVAPLDTARGVQNKVLEAVAAGLPTVVTPAVDEGLPDAIRPSCRVASTPGAFADAMVSLLSLSAAERRELASRSCLGSLSWNVRMAPLAGILGRAAGTAS